MKNSFKILLLSFTMLFTLASCGDDECEPGTLQETMVGTWGSAFEPGTAEFQADGTLLDPDDIIIGVEVNGVVYDQKTWAIDSDGSLFVTASNGTLSSDATFEVSGFTCDEVTLSVFGIPFTLERE